MRSDLKDFAEPRPVPHAPLPVDEVLAEIVDQLSSHSCVVLRAPPGAGKTTRVPAALLRHTVSQSGEVWVLEPRRLAARMAARRVAEEMGERVGQTVGFHVRFEESAGPSTRLRFMTEGVVTRRLLKDATLRDVSVVVIDEFHERHLEGDLVLAWVRNLQRTTRPDLRLVVMSATLDPGPLSAFLGDCPIVNSQGRTYPVEISYTPYTSGSIDQLVEQAVRRVIESTLAGDVLVFLPGAAEIRSVTRACTSLASQAGALLLALHGDLSSDEQDRVIRTAPSRKIILSTNVAESSVTIEGVGTVIDSGLARIASDSLYTGLPTLQVQRISQASAIQRAGRAGRTGPGRAIRLYSREDFEQRPAFDQPEILRRDLSALLLTLEAASTESLTWFEPPPEENLRVARELLDRLRPAEGSLDSLTRFPLHPRLARMLIEAEHRGVVGSACRVAALLSAGDRLTDHDLLAMADAEFALAPASQRIEKQLLLTVRRASADKGSVDELRIAVLTGYPDRVGRTKAPPLAQLSSGKFVSVAPGGTSGFFVAVDIEDRRDGASPLVRLSSSIEADWLLELYPNHIHELTELTWNRTAERVEERNALLYDRLVLDEANGKPRDTEAAADLLASKASEVGLHRFADSVEIEYLLARSEFAAQHSHLPSLTNDNMKNALRSLCSGLRSFSELEAQSRRSLLTVAKASLGAVGVKLLDKLAPERLLLKGRPVKIHYVSGQQPWIASALQDFYGMTEAPRIAEGRHALLVHLLAPNKRPVQVTADLPGFWKRLYPEVRRELSRRYPRHSWPPAQ